MKERGTREKISYMAKNKTYFEEVDLKVDFPALERKLLKSWYKDGIVKKYLKKNAKKRQVFSFIDGPITANNPMGVHHGWGRTYKDLWQRFKNMQGFRERFQNGFDAQGLWVEVEVEKELGLKSKKDIENLVPGNKEKSIAKFVDLCKERVLKYSKIQTEQSKRLGYFMDWDSSYYTMSDDNNYMIWRFLKKCHEMGLIYKGKDSVPWCPRCGTAISQHEMLTEDYREITHRAIYVSYPLAGAKDTYLLVWTTTPWTLPGNVAVAVNQSLSYALAEDPGTGKKYYLLEEKANRLRLIIHKKVKGDKLVGISYKSPFDGLTKVKKAMAKVRHLTISADERILPVSGDEGTGLVHVAPGAGAEDFALGKKLDLPVIDLIEEDASYLRGLGELSGKSAKKNPEIIFDYLKEKEKGKFFYKEESYKHRYPACWRCSQELVWRVVDEWYIAMDRPTSGSNDDEPFLTLRQKMVEVAKKIKWIPEFGLKRELDWLGNMHDWLISKKRYWGLALPIWVCEKCDNFEVVGGFDELKKKATKGWNEFKGNSPHKPWVDKIEIKCEKCGGRAKRISDVGNPWLDAGIVPFSTIKSDNKGEPLYKKDRRKWKNWFPADFITESFPGQFKNWFYALIAMSTVMENEYPFKVVLGFGTLLGEDGRAMHKSWGNAIEFNEGADKIGVDVMRFLYLSQNPAENLLFGYKVADEVRRKFHLKIWNIYNFFVTYANLALWRPGKRITKPKAQNPLDRWIIARFDETHGNLTGLLENYNAYEASMVLTEFVDDFSNWYIRRSRERLSPMNQNKKDKETCLSVTYYILVALSKVLSPFTPFLADTIYTNLTKEESVNLADWPNLYERIDTKLISDMKLVRVICEKVHSIRKEKGIPVRQPLSTLITISPEPIPTGLKKLLIEEVNVKKWLVKRGNTLENDLNMEITPELIEESKVRELIRKIQQERKEMGVSLTQKVKVASPWIPEDKDLIKTILVKTLSTKLSKGKFKVAKA